MNNKNFKYQEKYQNQECKPAKTSCKKRRNKFKKITLNNPKQVGYYRMLINEFFLAENTYKTSSDKQIKKYPFFGYTSPKKSKKESSNILFFIESKYENHRYPVYKNSTLEYSQHSLSITSDINNLSPIKDSNIKKNNAGYYLRDIKYCFYHTNKEFSADEMEELYFNFLTSKIHQIFSKNEDSIDASKLTEFKTTVFKALKNTLSHMNIDEEFLERRTIHIPFHVYGEYYRLDITNIFNTPNGKIINQDSMRIRKPNEFISHLYHKYSSDSWKDKLEEYPKIDIQSETPMGRIKQSVIYPLNASEVSSSLLMTLLYRQQLFTIFLSISICVSFILFFVCMFVLTK